MYYVVATVDDNTTYCSICLKIPLFTWVSRRSMFLSIQQYPPPPLMTTRMLSFTRYMTTHPFM